MFISFSSYFHQLIVGDDLIISSGKLVSTMSMQQMLTEFTEVTPTLFISSATAITETKLKKVFEKKLFDFT